MEFGRAEDINKADISLPDDHPDTKKLIKNLKKGKKKPVVYIGCAKWGRKEWIGMIYPPNTKEKDFLNQYLKQFNSIELNAPKILFLFRLKKSPNILPVLYWNLKNPNWWKK